MRILSPKLLSPKLFARLLFAATLSLAPLTALADMSATTGTLTVTGMATVETTPDLATLSLGVTTQGATAGAAMSANSAALAAVIARLKTAGIADRDIQTANLSLNPNWVTDGSGTASQIQGYTATNMLTIRIRALGTTGAVLDAAISDGANALNGLYFGLQNPRPAEDEARKQAVADAVARATLLAGAAGITLGPILAINDGGAAPPLPGPMFSMERDSAAVPVEAGSLGISASVTLVFQIGK